MRILTEPPIQRRESRRSVPERLMVTRGCRLSTPPPARAARAGDLGDHGVELGLVGGDRQDLRPGQADARRGRAG